MSRVSCPENQRFWPQMDTDNGFLLSDVQSANVAMYKYLNNCFQEAVDDFSFRKDDSMYHTLGCNAVNFIAGIIEFNESSLKHSTKLCNSLLKIIDAYRKHFSWGETIFGGSSELTDEELHAELVYAFSLLLKAVLTFLRDDNFASFVKGALTIRSSYRIFRHCEEKLASKDMWQIRNLQLKEHFEGGLKLGLGAFNLIMSTLPGKVLRLLEVVGFSGEKTTGLSELLECSRGNSVYSPLAALLLLAWNALGCFAFGIGNLNLEVCQELLDHIKSKYPQGFLTYYFEGRNCLISGDVPKATDFFEICMNSQEYCKQFKLAAAWDLMLINAYSLDYSKAFKISEMIQSECKWSPCVFSYLTFVFSLASGNVDRVKLEEMARQVSERRQRIAGRALPFEKYCTRKAERFLRGNFLPLAHWEFIYFWNGFEVLGRNPELLKIVQKNIQSEYENEGKEGNRHQLLAMKLLNSICLKHLGNIIEAEAELESVLEDCSEEVDPDFNYLLPTAMYELGRVQEVKGEYSKTKKTLLQAQKNRKYLMENKIQMRIRCALQQLETLMSE